MSQHVVLAVRYTVKPGKMDDVLAALGKMRPLALAEPGCITFDVNRAPDRDDALLLYEEYVDQAAVVAHGETAHFKEIILGIVVPLLASRERETYVPVLR